MRCSDVRNSKPCRSASECAPWIKSSSHEQRLAHRPPGRKCPSRRRRCRVSQNLQVKEWPCRDTSVESITTHNSEPTGKKKKEQHNGMWKQEGEISVEHTPVTFLLDIQGILAHLDAKEPSILAPVSSCVPLKTFTSPLSESCKLKDLDSKP